MPRANRYFLPGYVWHITHRCHNREFLLKFAYDKKRWLYWLFEAKKRYGLCILNYCVTSNHVHLLVVDTEKDCIAKSFQLIAGRVAQEYNNRKNRKGSFWEDRYHATAIMEDRYLLQCLVYVELNMVRAGVVKHPSEYSFCGFNEIINQPKRYTVIDLEKLKNLCGFTSLSSFTNHYENLIDSACLSTNQRKSPEWSESIAIGTQKYIGEIQKKLGVQAKNRETIEKQGAQILREPRHSYSTDFDVENSLLRGNNTCFWRDM